MTTAHFQSTSNEVEVTDKEAVAAILEEYIFPAEVNRILYGDKLAIRTPEMPNHGFHVDKIEDGEHVNDVTEEMYERIAEYLTEPLEINTVQTHGAGDSDITVTVTPDGEIKRENHNPAA